MSYTSQALLELKFGTDELLRIADRDGDGTIDAALVTDACTSATALVDSYVSQRYVVPLVGEGYHQQVASDIARYMLHDNAAPEEVQERYNNALNWLKAVAEGGLVVYVDGSPAPVRTSGLFGAVVPEPIITETTTAGY